MSVLTVVKIPLYTLNNNNNIEFSMICLHCSRVAVQGDKCWNVHECTAESDPVFCKLKVHFPLRIFS